MLLPPLPRLRLGGLSLSYTPSTAHPKVPAVDGSSRIRPATAFAFIVRSSTWLGAAIRTSHGRRMLHMVGRPLTVENGAGARLGRQIEAAQKLRVERDDDR